VGRQEKGAGFKECGDGEGKAEVGAGELSVGEAKVIEVKCGLASFACILLGLFCNILFPFIFGRLCFGGFFGAAGIFLYST
jgi:hypothetical protein